MASIYKQKERSRFWIARFKMPDGNWVSRTTKQTDRGTALRLAFEWEGISASPDELSPTGAAVARVTRQIFERATRSKVESVTVGDFLRKWNERNAATKSPGTAIRYKGVIDSFLAYLEPQGERRNIATLTPAVLQGFIDAESKAGKGAHTVSLAGKTLSAALKSANRAGLLENNPAASLELPGFAMQEREEFTPGELESLLTEARGTEWETVILLGAYCGCRLGDAVTMKWEAVDLAGAKLSFVPQKTSRGSRRKTQELPLAPRLLAHLETLAGNEAAQKNEFLSPGLTGAKTGGRSGLSLSFRALMRRAGVEGKITAKQKDTAARSFSSKTFHSLRHFFVSQLRRQGANLETAQAAAGHSDAATHARYDHDKHERVQRGISAAVAKFPGATEK